MSLRAVFLVLAMATAAHAQDNAADQARAAVVMLEEAFGQLDAADGARDRVQALTTTIQAFESGLAAISTPP